MWVASHPLILQASGKERCHQDDEHPRPNAKVHANRGSNAGCHATVTPEEDLEPQFRRGPQTTPTHAQVEQGWRCRDRPNSILVPHRPHV